LQGFFGVRILAVGHGGKDCKLGVFARDFHVRDDGHARGANHQWRELIAATNSRAS
jgi:hypothetical protein